MKILRCVDYNEMSQRGFDSIMSNLKAKPKLMICTATGNSPVGIYQKMADAYTEDAKYFKKLQIVKLDEWGGIPSKNPNSCEFFLQQKVLLPLHISKNRYISFQSDPVSPEKECERIQKEISDKGHIDICILGLGLNGHIGFNEPSSKLKPYCHVAQLSDESLSHQMAIDMDIKPRYGLTLGMADILHSKKIILLITGSNKRAVIQNLLSKKISSEVPASFLWLHPNVECYLDLNSI